MDERSRRLDGGQLGAAVSRHPPGDRDAAQHDGGFPAMAAMARPHRPGGPLDVAGGGLARSPVVGRRLVPDRQHGALGSRHDDPGPHAELRNVGGGHRGAVGDPVRQERPGAGGRPTHFGHDADHAGLRVPGAGPHVFRHRQGAGRVCHARLRDSAVGTPDKFGYPPGTPRGAGGEPSLWGNVMADAGQSAAAPGHAQHHDGHQSDHHAVFVHVGLVGHDRRRRLGPGSAAGFEPGQLGPLVRRRPRHRRHRHDPGPDVPVVGPAPATGGVTKGAPGNRRPPASDTGWNPRASGFGKIQERSRWSMRKRWLRRVFPVLLAAVLVASMGLAGDPAAAQRLPGTGKTLTFAFTNWTGDWLPTLVSKVLLEDYLGYRVEIVDLTVPVTYAMIAAGEVDVFADAFFPNQNSLLAGYRGELEVISWHYDDTVRGWAVPTWFAEKYGVKTVQDLNNPQIARLLDRDGDGYGDLLGC